MTATMHPRENYMPAWGATPKGVRSILIALSIWADESLTIEARVSEIVDFLDLELKTVRRHLAWATRHDLLSVLEQRRDLEARETRYRWRLSEKLSGLCDGRFRRARDSAASMARAEADLQWYNSSRSGKNVHSDVEPKAQGMEKMSCPEDKTSRDPVHAYGEHTRGRARPIHQIPSCFVFRDDEQRAIMEAVVENCGIGMYSPSEKPELLDSLAELIDDLVAEGCDPDLDIVKAIRKQTRHRRAKPIYHFRVLHDDVRAWHARRMAREARAKGFPTPSHPRVEKAKPSGYLTPARSDAQKLGARLAGWLNVIKQYDRDGTSGLPRLLLPRDEQNLSGALLEEAFERLVATYRVEVASMGVALPEVV